MKPERHTPRSIRIQNLTVSYHHRPAIRGINLEVETGVLVGVVGPNGAGKSTLMKAILHLVPWMTGTVAIHGRPVDEARREIAYVPQKESIDWDFPVTVRDVVMLGRYPHLTTFQRPGKSDGKVVDVSLEKVGMSEFRDRQIGRLSGGQQQRVFLARALAQEATIFLLDEPFVGVDAATEHAIIDLMRELRGEGKTVVVVNHDLVKVSEYFDRLLLINQRVVAYGPTKEVFQPELLSRTYGGRLTILQKADSLIGVAS